MTAPFDLTDDQLADQLRDLGAHLDLGPADTDEGRADLTAAVLASLADAPGADGAATDPVPSRDRRPARWLLVAAIVVLVVGLAVLTIAPAREAVARWFGIGGVRIERTDEPPPTSPSSTSSLPPAPTRPDGSIDLDALADALPFAVRRPDPSVAGEPVSAAVDPSVPSGLLEVRYPTFTLVELASEPGSTPLMVKVLGPGTSTEPVRVDGADGLWITGDPHDLAFLDPDGEMRTDRVRGAGDVLVWETDGVTYRIEGAASLDADLAIAGSLS